MANFNISYQIQAIDAFTKVAKDISASLKTMQSSLAGVIAKSNAAEFSLSRLGKKTVSIGKTISVGMGVPLTLLGKNIVATTAKYESAMQETGIITHATSAQLVALKKQQHDLGLSSKFSAQKIAEGQRLAFARIQDVAGAMKEVALANTAATATTSDLLQTIRGGTIVMKAFGGGQEMLEEINSALAVAYAETGVNIMGMAKAFQYAGPLARQAGLDFDDLTAALIAALKVDPSGMAGRQLRVGIRNLEKPSKIAAAAIRILGHHAGVAGNMFYQANGKMVHFAVMLERLKKAQQSRYFAKGGAGGLKAFNDAIMSIFSTRSSEFMAILVQQAKEYNRIHTDVLAGSILMDKLAKTKMSTLQGSLWKLSSAWQIFTLDIGQANEGPFKDLIDKLTTITIKLDKSKTPLKKFIGGFIEAGIVSGPIIIGVGKLAIGIGLLAKTFPSLFSSLGAFAVAVAPFAAIAVTLGLLYEKSETFRNSIDMINSALSLMFDKITGNSSQAKKDMQELADSYNKVAIGERALLGKAGTFLSGRLSSILPTATSIESPGAVRGSSSKSIVHIIVDDVKGYVKKVTGEGTGASVSLNVGTHMAGSR